MNCDYLFLSLGENCLTDNILDRHGVKSFSTPYSHGRSNIDYAIALERQNYEGLLEKSTLYYPNTADVPKLAVRSNLINECDEIYSQMHMRGFEFTHHDVINNQNHRDSFKRKISRMLECRADKILFFYHYRTNPMENLEKLYVKLNEFLRFYSNAKVIVFFQRIISKNGVRKISKTKISDNLFLFEFFTFDVWGGDIQDLFWAKVDDDLIEEMIIESGKIVKTNGT